MIFPLKYYKIVERALIITVLVLTFQFTCPHIVHAQEIQASNELGPVFVQIVSEKNMTEKIEPNALPEVENREPKMVRWVTVTAYSSTVDQCDSTPFITASNKHVYDGLVAANFLYFGTKVKFPDYFGDKVFTVDDRMNKKYNSRMDVWFHTREQAKQFGVRYLKVEIY